MKTLTLIFLLLIPAFSHAQDYKWGVAGIGLLTLPIVFESPESPWGHGIELAGFSYAGVDLGDAFLCEKCNWEVPLFVSLFNLGYRYVESTEGDKYAWQKFGCDESGVLVRFSLDFI